MLTAIIGVIANMLVILVIARNKNLKTVNNMIILNLAINDFMYCALLLPLNAIESWNNYRANTIFGDFTCLLFHYLTESYELFRVWLLVIISLEQYIAIVHTVSKVSIKFRTHGNAIMVILLLWLISLIISLFMIFMVRFKEIHDNDGTT